MKVILTPKSFKHKPHPKDICICHHSRKEHSDKGICYARIYTEDNVKICSCGKFREHLNYSEGK